MNHCMALLGGFEFIEEYFSNPGMKPGYSYERRCLYENQKGLEGRITDLQVQKFLLTEKVVDEGGRVLTHSPFALSIEYSRC